MKTNLHELPDEAFALPHTRTYPMHTKEHAEESLRQAREHHAAGKINTAQMNVVKNQIEGALNSGKFPGKGPGPGFGGERAMHRPVHAGGNQPKGRLSEYVRDKRTINNRADKGMEGHAARGRGRQLNSDDDEDTFPVVGGHASVLDRTRMD